MVHLNYYLKERSSLLNYYLKERSSLIFEMAFVAPGVSASADFAETYSVNLRARSHPLLNQFTVPVLF